MSSSKIDAITFEVVNNALHSIAEEIGLVLMRTARSQLFHEGGDTSCALWDGQGNMGFCLF
jgi:N-methylhydantoinase B